MAHYIIKIKASIPAQNFESAQKKSDDLKAKLVKAGGEYTEVHIELEDKPSSKS